MNTFPCTIIRGICNYADSHKNENWQAYAAATAAAYAKELTSTIPPSTYEKTRNVEDTMHGQCRDDITMPDNGTTDYVERSRGSSYYIPFTRNHRFIARSLELDRLKSKLFIIRECRKVALVGLGGIGKSQLALALAYTVKEEYPDYFIFWLPALSLESFEQACAKVCRILDSHATSSHQKDAKELLRRYLSTSTAGRWLLIVDNADDKNLFLGDETSKGLNKYLPKSDDGMILFTSRHQEVAVSLAGSDVIELQKTSLAEATAFLKRS